MTKICTNCLEQKDLDEFNRQSENKDGLQYYCRTCMAVKVKENYEINRERRIAKALKRQQENPEKSRLYVKRMRQRRRAQKQQGV